VVTLVPKSSASPLHFYPWDSVDPDMGPLCISCEIGREMWEGPREGKLPDMSESIVGAEGKAMTWTDRQCGKALHRKPCTCTEGIGRALKHGSESTDKLGKAPIGSQACLSQ
ncbi:hypothetical protein EV363DRAFT_1202553, partial [Boletus edulis]